MQLGLLLVLILLVVLLFSGLPVAFGLGFTVLAGMLLLWGPAGFHVMAWAAYDAASSEVLISLPLFVLMSQLILHSGAVAGFFDSVNKWIGRLPGGVAMSTIGASAAAGSVIGISTATAASVSVAAIPEMKKCGYSPRLSAGSVAGGGTLGILIPPSIGMIVFGVIAEVSIGRLFLAGVIPGVILAAIMMTYIVIHTLHNPKIAPRAPSFTFSEKVKSLVEILPVLLLGLSMLYGLYSGIVSANEVGAVGVILSFGVLAIMRKFSWNNIRESLLATVRISCMCFWIIIAGMALGSVVTYGGLSENITQIVLGVSPSKYVILLMINLFLIVLGCFLDGSAITIITVPILLPIIKSLGLDPIWFGVLFIINMEMGLLSPPFGMNLFVVKTVNPDVAMSDIIMGALPFVLCQAVMIVILIVFPDLALFLPSLMI